jgi:hypothetical protein
MIKHLLACALVATTAAAHADPYAGPSFGKATCAEYNQLQQDGTIAMWSWVEEYIAGATRIGRQTKQSRFDRLDHLNYKLIMVVVDGACKAEPSLNFENLAGSILNRLLEEPDKYK